MSQSGSIRVVKGLKFAGYDNQNNELCYQGTLGSTKYIFDTTACKKFFGINFGNVIEFMLDPTSPAFTGDDTEGEGAAAASLRPKTFKDFLGRYFLPIGVMISPQEAVDAAAAEHASNQGGAAPTDEEAAESLHNNLPLYAVDINDLSLICLSEATSQKIINARYPARVCDQSDHGLFDSIPPNFPFGFSTTTLYGKFFVKENEHVYLANLQDSAVIIGEAFGCVWVALESKKGKIVPLPKATDEARLVTLYGLSDISNAPQPGSSGYDQQTPISPRQIQTPRANEKAGGPPFVLGKKTADGKSAVLCNCPMNQTVLAVCTAEALKPFEVKPMGRIFFSLGVDAGKSATILGIKNGSLYIHVDGAQKCICLRNATNAQELRERYTGSDGKSSSSQTSHYMSPSQTMPRSIGGPIPQPSTLPDETKSSSPLGSIPRLSLGRLGAALTGNNNTESGQISPNPRGSQQISPIPNRQGPPYSPGSPGRGFYYWTANGCLKFDISAEACGHFGVRHSQTHRFTSGPDAGQLFHIVGVHAGNLYVVQDHRQLAGPLRYCQDETDVKSRVGPSLISTTKLRSADPRGQAPSLHPLRSPDRRAGSPFGLSPRNYQPEPNEDVGEWGKPTPRRAASDHQLGSRNEASSNFVSNANNNNMTSGSYGQMMGEASASYNNNQPRGLSIQKSLSPHGAAHSGSSNNMMMNASASKYMSPSASGMENAASSNNLTSGAFGAKEFSVSIGRQNRNQSTTAHPMDEGGHSHAHFDRSESAATSLQTDSVVKNTKIPAPRPVRHDAFKVGNMPSTRLYLKAIALRALGVKRDADMPTAFFRFFSHDAGQNLSRALKEMTKFQTYWEQREKPMRGGRGFHEATTDMMVEALENLAQLRGEN